MSGPSREPPGAIGTIPDEPAFDVLQALRVRGLSTESVLAERSGSPVGAIAASCARLADAGWIMRRDGAVAGWTLTEEGRVIHERECAARHAAPAAAEALHGAQRRFASANAEVLAVCSAWQVRRVGGAAIPNDHDDADYDAALVERLRGAHRQAVRLCTTLGAPLPRFLRYADRLTHALARVADGATEWMTSPRVDSYHTVWFELHEDLLVTLGLDRSDAAAD